MHISMTLVSSADDNASSGGHRRGQGPEEAKKTIGENHQPPARNTRAAGPGNSSFQHGGKERRKVCTTTQVSCASRKNIYVCGWGLIFICLSVYQSLRMGCASNRKFVYVCVCLLSSVRLCMNVCVRQFNFFFVCVCERMCVWMDVCGCI